MGGTQEGAYCTSDSGCAGGTCQTLFDFSDRLAAGVGPVLLAEIDFDLGTRSPVPLDGLIESEALFALFSNEAIEERDGRRLRHGHLRQQSARARGAVRRREPGGW